MSKISIGDVVLQTLTHGSGEPLLLVHGFPLDHTMWRGQIEVLAESALVIAPDLRGFGASDVTPGVVTMAQLADDLAALLSALRIDQPVTFCGLSMGGYVAWQFWQRHRQRLRRLILCDTQAAADTPEAAEQRLETAERIMRKGPEALAETMVSKLFALSTRREQPELAKEVHHVICRTAPEGMAAALYGMAQRADFTAKLSQVDVPALVICGEEDRITPVDEMRAMSEEMPHAEFASIARAGHLAPLEQPEAVNRAIRAFLG